LVRPAARGWLGLRTQPEERWRTHVETIDTHAVVACRPCGREVGETDPAYMLKFQPWLVLGGVWLHPPRPFGGTYEWCCATCWDVLAVAGWLEMEKWCTRDPN
jgi:hypothetical protein